MKGVDPSPLEINLYNEIQELVLCARSNLIVMCFVYVKGDDVAINMLKNGRYTLLAKGTRHEAYIVGIPAGCQPASSPSRFWKMARDMMPHMLVKDVLFNCKRGL
jgi:hypothetical protein